MYSLNLWKQRFLGEVIINSWITFLNGMCPYYSIIHLYHSILKAISKSTSKTLLIIYSLNNLLYKSFQKIFEVNNPCRYNIYQKTLPSKFTAVAYSGENATHAPNYKTPWAFLNRSVRIVARYFVRLLLSIPFSFLRWYERRRVVAVL